MKRYIRSATTVAKLDLIPVIVNELGWDSDDAKYMLNNFALDYFTVDDLADAFYADMSDAGLEPNHSDAVKLAQQIFSTLT